MICIAHGQKKQITGVLANYHFAPTTTSANNLLKENKNPKDIVVTGNTVIDALFLALDKIEKNDELKSKIIESINSQYELKDDEYIVLCDYDNMAEIRNQVLNEGGHKLTIAGREYKSKYANCKNGYIEMAASHINTGIILVPDNCPLTEDMKEKTVSIMEKQEHILILEDGKGGEPLVCGIIFSSGSRLII